MAAVPVAILCVACASALPRPERAPQPQDAFEVVTSPPPPGRVENVPAQPSGDAVWLDGGWRWTGARYAWELGRWVIPPPHARYAEWESRFRADGAILFAPSSFRDARGDEVPEPPALAVGRARSDQVIDPEGRRTRTAPNLPPENGPRPDGRGERARRRSDSRAPP